MAGNPLAAQTLLDAEGWDALDLSNFDKSSEAERQQMLLIAGHYQEVFTRTEQGRFVLEQLVADYMMPRTANPGDDLITIGIRQGSQDVVRKILALIELARSGGAPT